MPPKEQFSRNDIINTAFSIARKKGAENLSVRAIAKKLKSSTMPIYSHFPSIKEIHLEVAQKSIGLLADYLFKKRSGDVLFDFGIGHLLFSIEEKHLFRVMFLNSDPLHMSIVNEKRDAYQQIMENNMNDINYKNKTEIKKLLLMMNIFAHGLACLLNFERIEPMSKEELYKIMKEACDSFDK